MIDRRRVRKGANKREGKRVREQERENECERGETYRERQEQKEERGRKKRGRVYVSGLRVCVCARSDAGKRNILMIRLKAIGANN